MPACLVRRYRRREAEPPGSPTDIASAVVGAQDRLTRHGTTTYSYGRDGQLQSKTNTTMGQTTSYTYDALGALKAAGLPDGRDLTYVTDPLRRRVAKKVNSTMTQQFLYGSGLGPVAELNPDGTVKSRFVYAIRSNVPDYVTRDGRTYRLISDVRGSPRLVVDTQNGDIAQRLDYDEFGNVTTDTSPGFQPFGYAGGLYDPDTKLVRFGARDYDPAIGRWTAKDPIRFDGGDTNLYGYVVNDPINGIDPSGLVLGLPSMGEVGTRLAGFADGVTFGLTSPITSALGVPKCSFDYRVSRDIGQFTGSVELGVAGGAGAATRIHSVARSTLPRAARAISAIGGGAVGGATEATVTNRGRPSASQLARGALFGALGGAAGDFARGSAALDTTGSEGLAGWIAGFVIDRTTR